MAKLESNFLKVFLQANLEKFSNEEKYSNVKVEVVNSGNKI